MSPAAWSPFRTQCPSRMLGSRQPGLVVACYVEDDVRRQLGLPEDDEGGIRNATALLLETAWPRELVLHEGDAGAAATCLIQRLRDMLDAPNNQAVGGARPRAVHCDAQGLDPRFLVA